MPSAVRDSLSETISAGFFLADESRFQIFENSLRPSGMEVTVHKTTRGMSDFVHELEPAEMSALRFILLDLDGQNDPVGVTREVIGRSNPEAKIVALGTKNDVELFRALRACGVSDYLVLPVSGPSLLQAVEMVLGKSVTARHSTTVAFVATHGGIGAGLLTAGTAAYIARVAGRDCLAGDTDLATSSVGSHLGNDKAGELSMLLEAGERLDNSLIRQVMRPIYDNLFLLNGYSPHHMSGPEETATAKLLLSLLDKMHRFQVWRVAGTGPLVQAVLEEADAIYLVATGSLASAAACQNMTDWIADRNKRATISLVYNNVSPRLALTALNLSQVTGKEIRLTIPFRKELGRELIGNRPLTEKGHSMYSFFQTLGGEIVGEKADVRKSRGLFGRLGL